MSQTLPDRIRQAPGMSAGLVLGVLIGLLTGNWIIWIVIGGILGLAWDRRRRRG
jgi:mannose/fructose/N-acetylgalactosamine-specific phosphotransferase system component IIC